MEEKKIGNNKDVEENKVIAAIGYLWILCFIPLFLKKDSKFAKFHGKQALVLFIIDIIVAFLGWIPVFGWILWLLAIIATIVGLLQALAGKWYKLPIIGQLADKINL
jgi:fumarate reductase subunit D